ncbi:MAG: ChbG/HpnK family deacetylase [Xanthobacteraceae bacterium]
MRNEQTASRVQQRIVLCADDYGISPAVNVAIRDLIVRGRLNATSVMVTAPGFNRFEAAALGALNASARRAAIGLHFTLTAPFRPLSRGFAPLRDGSFLPLGGTLMAALLGRFGADALAAEVRAQIAAFRSAFGRAPDFIDGHQHVHIFPQVGEAVLTVAKEEAPGAWLRQCGRVTTAAPWTNPKAFLLDVLSRRFRERAAALGVRTNPAFAGAYAFRDDADFAVMFPGFLDGLPDGSVVMCHPGFVDDELKRLDPLTTLREREYAFLGGDAFPAVLASRGMTIA